MGSPRRFALTLGMNRHLVPVTSAPNNSLPAGIKTPEGS